jgi:hypothetical protein
VISWLKPALQTGGYRGLQRLQADRPAPEPREAHTRYDQDQRDQYARHAERDPNQPVRPAAARTPQYWLPTELRTLGLIRKSVRRRVFVLHNQRAAISKSLTPVIRGRHAPRRLGLERKPRRRQSLVIAAKLGLRRE